MSRAAGAIWHPSPNFGVRRGGLTPSLIVIHYTAMATATEALTRLCDPEHEVSAHYLISEQGELSQLVDEAARAWHAGAGSWGGKQDMNSRSIGIELANNGSTPFSARLMDRLESLLREIMERWAIQPKNIIGHSDMAPDRKFDPGPRFDWQRLARQRLGVWPSGDLQPCPIDPGRFREDAIQFGYPDLPIEFLLPAFRHRFRPSERGDLGSNDMATMAALAASYPVDRSAGLA